MSYGDSTEKPSNIEAMVNLNVLSPMLMTNCFLEDMKLQSSGHIVTISSTSAFMGSPNTMFYAATKGAENIFMASLTENLRIGQWSTKIKTTCICPNFLDSNADVLKNLNPK